MTQREIKVLAQRPPAPARQTIISQLQIQHYIGVCLFGPDCVSAEFEGSIIEEEEVPQIVVEMKPTTDILQVLHGDDIQELLKVLASDLPKSAVVSVCSIKN